jgi:hypothetical protein
MRKTLNRKERRKLLQRGHPTLDIQRVELMALIEILSGSR